MSVIPSKFGIGAVERRVTVGFGLLDSNVEIGISESEY